MTASKQGPDLTELRQIFREMAGADFLVTFISAMRDNMAFCEKNFHSLELCEIKNFRISDRSSQKILATKEWRPKQAKQR